MTKSERIPKSECRKSDLTRVSRSTFELRISFGICHWSFVIPPVHGPSLIIALALAGALCVGCKRSQPPDSTAPQRRGAATFNRDVAPILFQHCAPCHRPGQSAPFSLLSYADALKHASEIAEVTRKRYMPPWLPEHGYGDFRDERRLTTAQIEAIQKWFADGAPEGEPADRPALPQFAEGWQLGEPDLVVQMPQPYTLSAEGRAIYPNFVLPPPRG